MKLPYFICCRVLLLTICCLLAGHVAAQNLDRNVSVNVKQKRLADLLTEIGKKGNFYFSYSSEMLHADSLVTISASNKTVRSLLDDLFRDQVDYKETLDYIILRPAPNRLALIPDDNDEPGTDFIISGYVTDEITGKKLAGASIFEKSLLVSALTDDRGFFRLKLKATGNITLTVSKELYKDTTVNFLSKVTVTTTQRSYTYSPEVVSNKTDKSWLGRWFVSSKLKMQSLNIGGYISGVPFQASFIPGLGSHGLLNGQIVNKFSLNMLGGYNAGVNGLELGGLYNINKHNAKYVQAAGLLNAVGGDVSGVQLAGISNTVYKSLSGVEAAGILNKIDQDAKGVQLAGISNLVNKNFTGVEAAGILNKVGQNLRGIQLAGIANLTGKTAHGMQVAGIFNSAHLQNGVHIALFNVADTLNGYAINLLSFSKNGYKQLQLSTDESLITSLGFKTGTAKFYTKLIGGVNLTDTTRYYMYGLSFGHDFKLGQKALLSAEFSAQVLASPQWNNMHQLDRFSALVHIPFATKAAIFFGPSINLYDVGQNNTPTEQNALLKNKVALTGIGQSFKAWLGWSVGISLF
jgi:hypothetical protein